MKKLRFITYAGLFILLTVHGVMGQKGQTPQQTPNTRILFIFDASRSMKGPWEGSRKIQIARDYLIQMVDSLKDKDHLQMALRVYGHQHGVPPQNCNDTKLEVPFAEDNASKIKQTLRYLRPKGTTPIARSLAKAKNDFPASSNSRNLVILITDGKEACEGDPCAVSETLQKEGIILRPFIIGIGVDPSFHESFDCAGDFHNAPNKNRFKNNLKVVITQALNTTTAQVNLLDAAGRPTETNQAMTFYNHISGKARYNLMHTLDYKGNPDTLTLDPLVPYDLVVHTIPPVRKDSIVLSPGKHNIIGVDAPQGMLKVISPGTNQYRGLKFLVRRHGKSKTLNVQEFEKTQKYLTGQYDLEVLTLPRKLIQDVKIKQSHTTTVEIPKPGIVNILFPSYGHGSLLEQKKSGELKQIYDFHSHKKRESLILQPGDYKIVFRTKSMRKSMYTITRSFHIKSGSSTTITL